MPAPSPDSFTYTFVDATTGEPISGVTPDGPDVIKSTYTSDANGTITFVNSDDLEAAAGGAKFVLPTSLTVPFGATSGASSIDMYGITGVTCDGSLYTSGPRPLRYLGATVAINNIPCIRGRDLIKDDVVVEVTNSVVSDIVLEYYVTAHTTSGQDIAVTGSTTLKEGSGPAPSRKTLQFAFNTGNIEGGALFTNIRSADLMIETCEQSGLWLPYACTATLSGGDKYQLSPESGTYFEVNLPSTGSCSIRSQVTLHLRSDSTSSVLVYTGTSTATSVPELTTTIILNAPSVSESS